MQHPPKRADGLCSLLYRVQYCISIVNGIYSILVFYFSRVRLFGFVLFSDF